MCGHFGVLFPTQAFDSELKQMQEVLGHRGPDAKGLESVKGGVLGHVRLSIIDLSPAGAQPLWDASRTICIVYNGEIYNHVALRVECQRAGMSFRSTSDTEVIVNQYLLHGEASFDRLNGIFSFCLFDSRSGEFYLVRDPMGVKPLYYARTPKGLFFASELKAFLRTGVVPLDVDDAALRAYLQLDFVPSPMCMIKDVHKLRGGDLLHIKSATDVRLKTYTSLHDAQPTVAQSLDQDLAQFDSIFEDAVARQWVADVPVGVFLSGGIDSSLVAQAAAARAGGPIDTFSMAFEDASFDESDHAAAVAVAIGSRHHVETVSARSMLDLWPMLPRLACEPLADGSIIPTALLCRFARKHVTVALSGDGADELFAGYPTYLAARVAPLSRLVPTAVLKTMSSLAERLIPVSLDNFSWDFKLKKFLAGLHPDPLLQNARWLGTFSPTALPKLLKRCPPPPFVDLETLLHERANLAAPSARLERLLRMDERFYLQDGVLVKVDRASMASSLEVRVPFLDAEVVRFCRRLPAGRKLRGQTLKFLLRRYGRRRLPASILARPKKGFGAPIGRWFKTELKELVADTLAPARLERQGLFDPAYVQRLLQAHFRGAADCRKQIFNLLTFCLWYDEYRIQAAS